MPKTKKLYKNNKLYKKIFDTFFNDFGWDCTHIEKDTLLLFNNIKKFAKDKYAEN